MRMEYLPVAVRTQILFFCVSDLANVDPMYQYSLEWFLNIFLSGIANSERAGSPGMRAHGHRCWAPSAVQMRQGDTSAPGARICKLLPVFTCTSSPIRHDNTPPPSSEPLYATPYAPRGGARHGCGADWLGWAEPRESCSPHLPRALPSPPWPADNLKKRIANINRHLTYSLYSNVCRSLFEKHKLMFAFLLCVRIMMNENKIDQVHERRGSRRGRGPRTHGLRRYPWQGLGAQGGRKEKAGHEGTARAKGQRPQETGPCLKQPGEPGFVVAHAVLGAQPSQSPVSW